MASSGIPKVLDCTLIDYEPCSLLYQHSKPTNFYHIAIAVLEWPRTPYFERIERATRQAIVSSSVAGQQFHFTSQAK